VVALCAELEPARSHRCRRGQAGAADERRGGKRHTGGDAGHGALEVPCVFMKVLTLPRFDGEHRPSRNPDRNLLPNALSD
jgi:hypothetical protein